MTDYATRLKPADQAPRFHTTKARIGGALVYAIGDVHGRYDLFREMLALIAADIPRRAAGRRPVLVPCGDYIDRGPQSAEVLAALDWLRRDPRIELHAIKGNHEQKFLAFIKNPADGLSWLTFGGDATLRSYGVAPPIDFEDGDDCLRARDDLLERMPAAHVKLLEELEMMAIIGDYAFVHAGIRPGVKLARQRDQDLMWIRDGFLEQTRTFEKRIVHGHSWTEAEPEIFNNRIGLDTGAYQTGVLTAVRIEDGEVELLQTGR